ncbi:bifunctional salicylyl-CoA 5-hydroxylase/oxidoreductase [Haliangium sp.]|uniref:bifunctional salicylyl-CoA 5-hydroxylase/oxidoreductase n=1 Tax=Haliangium sp. TaxID=2663208 RepID=UPI003D11D84D
MKIACIGGGPAGLYFAILMKKLDPAHQITVYERNRPGDTFGWGVVFSDQTLENLSGADEDTRREIIDSFAHWDDIDIHFGGRVIRSGGHAFCGIARRHLLEILARRAEGLGVELVYEREVEGVHELADADLIVAADGINSKVRSAYAEHFRPDIAVGRCKYIWLGTHKLFEAFTFLFEQTAHGWFTVHAYRFDDDTSTFIVEAPEEVWQAEGLAEADTAASIDFCERLFGKYLDGHRLMSNAGHMVGSPWVSFRRVLNQTWIKDNVVLMGDAAHTAHFSIGSGTKLALEDAIALAQAFERAPDDVAAALRAYENERKLDVLRLQSAARNSMSWFEHVDRYTGLAPEQFAYSLLTRSQRVSHENLRLRDRAYLEAVERWYFDQAVRTAGASDADGGAASEDRVHPPAPMFAPLRLRGVRLDNRVVVSPMAMYSAEDGVAGDFHLVHLGSRAVGGAGLVFTEMTCVSAEGRITPGCAGLYTDAHTAAWRRIVDFVHANSRAKICAQLGHAGPKGATKLGWEGMDEPLDAAAAWALIAPSAQPWKPGHQVPRAMTRADMDAIRDQFVAAVARAAEAGFDMVELHMAHGYLLSAFLSPLSNQRSDDYGGSLERRLRFPLEVFEAARAAWPDDRPMSVRISATDWHPQGLQPDDAVEIARALAARGVDLIDVSAGQTSPEARPVYGRMFQTPLSDQIRNQAGVATMAVGNIYEPDHVNSILAAGRADLVAMARPHLADPYWTLHAAARLGYADQAWPPPYLAGKEQLERLQERAADMALLV